MTARLEFTNLWNRKKFPVGKQSLKNTEPLYTLTGLNAVQIKQDVIVRFTTEGTFIPYEFNHDKDLNVSICLSESLVI